jgi:hypothetical protein
MYDFFFHVSPASTESCDSRIVTLLCFGAPNEVHRRFVHLLGQMSWKDVISEPYLLFDVLFDELYGVFDDAVWELSKAVNPEEKMALERAGGDEKLECSLNFQNLYNIQKCIIFSSHQIGSLR